MSLTGLKKLDPNIVINYPKIIGDSLMNNKSISQKSNDEHIAEALDFLSNSINDGSDPDNSTIANMVQNHLKDSDIKVTKKEINKYLKESYT